MIALFIACAAVGTVGLILHLLLGVLGAVDDHDERVDPATVRVEFDTRILSAALAFFGLAGAAAAAAGWSPAVSVVIALLLALAIGAGLALALRTIRRREVASVAPSASPIGMTAVVSLRIPAERSGTGRVHLPLQGRTLEFHATTTGSALPSGTVVVVSEVVPPDTLDVVAKPSAGAVRPSNPGM